MFTFPKSNGPASSSARSMWRVSISSSWEGATSTYSGFHQHVLFSRHLKHLISHHHTMTTTSTWLPLNPEATPPQRET